MNSPFWSLVMRNFLEFFSMVPCAVLCFLPVQDRLRQKPLNIFLTGIPLSILWAFAGGLVCAGFGIARDFWVLPSFILFAVFFHRVCDPALWKPFSILTAVCAVFSCITNLTLVADALIDRTNISGLFTLPGAGIHLLLSVLIVAIVWYPATHAAKWLVDDIEMAKTWYIFWVFPAAFFLLNRLIRPRYYETLYTNRVMKFYPILILALLTFLLLFYFMFYLMASEMNQNTRLLRENELLQLQSAQYRNLQRSIDETRIARHDLRQHLTVLSGYAANKDLDAISDYLASFRKHMMPEWLPAYCENQAVNAILSYYAQIAEKAGTALEIQAQMAIRQANRAIYTMSRVFIFFVSICIYPFFSRIRTSPAFKVCRVPSGYSTIRPHWPSRSTALAGRSAWAVMMSTSRPSTMQCRLYSCS